MNKEIVFVPFPFTDLSTMKKKPVLILSKTDYNRRSQNFICSGITSNPRNIVHSVLIESKDLLTGVLPKPSRVKVDKIFTLEKSIVIRSFGSLMEEVMKKVKEEFYKLF